MKKENQTAFAVFMKSIAKVPESQRRYIMRDAFKVFIGMPEERRLDLIRNVMETMSLLDNVEMETLIKTRLESLGEFFNEDERKDLLKAHLEALSNLSEEIRDRDLKITFKIIDRLEENNRGAILNAIEALLSEKSEGEREKLMNLFPEEGRKLFAY